MKHKNEKAIEPPGIRADGERIMNLLNAIAETGMGADGGVTRLAFSQEYFETAERLRHLLPEECQGGVYRDFAGNLHVIRRGGSQELPEIAIGSHLDTVPEGGRFDGAAGIAAGVEVFRLLEAEGRRLRHNLHLILFNAEEAGPLGGTFGSRALLSQADQKTPEAQRALELVAGRMKDIPLKEPGLDKVKCFVELHIEQGGVLDQEKLPIGVVSGIYGIRRYAIRMKGQSNHGGTTPMRARKDPLAAMARWITFVYEKAEGCGSRLVATVGKMDVKPNLESVIPGEVEAILEIRSLSEEKMDGLWEEAEAFGKSCKGVSWEGGLKVDKPPLHLDGKMISIIETACGLRGVPYKKMPSGAGHDAKSFGAAGIPAGMIFIPSVGGKSHCKEEFSTPEQLALGADVLYQAILLLDGC